MTKNNGIYLEDDIDTLKKKVMSLYTDPNHINVDVFGWPEDDEIAAMKEH